MDVHVLTLHGAELVVQVVDGQVIVPTEGRPACTIEASESQMLQGLTSTSNGQ